MTALGVQLIAGLARQRRPQFSRMNCIHHCLFLKYFASRAITFSALGYRWFAVSSWEKETYHHYNLQKLHCHGITLSQKTAEFVIPLRASAKLQPQKPAAHSTEDRAILGFQIAQISLVILLKAAAHRL